MLQSTLPSRRVKVSRTFSLDRPAVADATGLTDTPRETSPRVARRIVQAWTGYFALSVAANDKGQVVTFDVRRGTFLRCIRQAARRYKTVLLSETFGTLTLGA